MVRAGSPWDGPNMRRVRESDVISHLRVGVVAGPGDTELWELCASLEAAADLPLEIAGRGSDLEAAAGSVLSTLAMHFPAPHEPTDAGGQAPDGVPA